MGMGVKHYLKSGKQHKAGLHKMPNGDLHTGKTHGPNSQKLFHYGDLAKDAKVVAKKSWGK
jgi:hypothetical protein|tara:strand:- start:210 stop:392 length:183 start_codon:yes stop_codon:yes gene_type:complete